jgi:dolichol-phosphate mannosyltransferase
LAIVVPTYNERDNIAELLRRLESTLSKLKWEVIFVDDDSPDGTADRVRELARQDTRIRCLKRIGRRGLSSAVTEGIMATGAPVVAVMDADLQHDESLLPKMYAMLQSNSADLVIGSRLVEGGSTGALGDLRSWLSRALSAFSRWLLRLEVRDLMSGYFMLKRDIAEDAASKTSGTGFKILLDIITASPCDMRIVEIPYTFRPRLSGDSKADSGTAAALGMMLLDKTIGRVLPTRLVAFVLVGGFGVIVHFAALTLALKAIRVDFVTAQATATLVAMTSNFALNNLFTYRDARLRGWRWIRGWLTFTGACAFGAVANVGVAGLMFSDDFSWQLSALAGVLVGTAWNYGVTKAYTWRV